MNTQQKAIANCMQVIGATIEVATYIAAQSTLETGNFQSDIYKENRNLFGMKLAKTRITTTKEANRNHAKYESIGDSITDYIFWLIYNGFNQNTLKDLDKFKLRLSNSGYCPLKDYIERINNIYEQIKNN